MTNSEPARTTTLRTVLLIVGGVVLASVVFVALLAAVRGPLHEDASRVITVDDAFTAIEVNAEVTDVVIEYGRVDEPTVRFAQNGERSSMSFDAEVVDGVLVAEVLDGGRGWLSWSPFDFAGESPRLTIVLPRQLDDLDLDFTGYVGDVFLDADFADVTIDTNVGDLRLSGSAQNADIEAGVGDLSSSDYSVGGDLYVRSSTGDITFDLAVVPNGLRVEANVGDVEFTVPAGDYRVETTSNVGDVQMHAHDDESSHTVFTFESNVGDIRINS